MSKYNKVTWQDVLKKYIEIQDKLYEIGNWYDGVSMRFIAHELNTSKYQIRKCYKELIKRNFIELTEVPTKTEDYYNGLYDETVVVLKTKVYVLTKKAREYINGISEENKN